MAGLKKDDVRRLIRRKSQHAAAFDAMLPRAIAALAEIIGDAKDSDRLKAIELVLAYGLGKPRQQVDVAATVSTPSAAHVAVLRDLTIAVQHDTASDANVLISFGNSAERDKLTLNHMPASQPMIDITPSPTSDKAEQLQSLSRLTADEPVRADSASITPPPGPKARG